MQLLKRHVTTTKSTVCQLSTLHYALDTRIFYKYAQTLHKHYRVIVIGIHPKKEVIKGIEIIPFKIYKNRTWRLFTSWFNMFRMALKTKADLFHIHDPELLPCALLLHIIGKKVIIDVHENIAADIFDKDWIKFKKTTYNIFNFVESIACKRIPVILAESSYEHRYKQISKNTTTVHNYVAPQFFNELQGLNRNPLHLFYMGIVLENRCIFEIIASVHELHNRGYKVHFHCVGQRYSKLVQEIEKNETYQNLKAYIHFYGRKNLSEGYKISQQCGIGLCLIKPMSNSIESKPTKIFEYMAIGLPIITSDFKLYKKLVSENGVGMNVNPISVEEISNAIEKLINDPVQIKEISEKGKMLVNTCYNWETEAKKLEEKYAEILA